jgi:hypothetical protein
MLHEFITLNRDEIILRCRAKVATRSVPPPTEVELNHGVPLFLDQLVATLRGGQDQLNPEISRSAVLHGYDLLRQGFTVSQVVHDYGDICQSVTELALEQDAPISTDDFRTLNRCLDDAIAGAVTEFGRGRNQSTLEGADARGNERLGFLAHELRNLMNTSILAFDVLRTGDVGVGGSTGQVLRRNLVAAGDLIGHSLAEVRLTHGIQKRERVEVAGFIEEVAHAARLTANERDITFTVMPVEDGVVIEADRQVISSVIENLLQNAFNSLGRVPSSRYGSPPAPAAYSSRSEMNAGACQGRPPACSARLTNEVWIEAGWGWASRTAGGPSKRIADESMRVPFQARGACLRSTYRGPPFPLRSPSAGARGTRVLSAHRAGVLTGWTARSAIRASAGRVECPVIKP